MRKASAGVVVDFERNDPGQALACRAYTGDAAHSLFKRIGWWARFFSREFGWDGADRRQVIEACARRAHELFEQQLGEKLTEALEELKVEVMFQAVRDQGPPAFARIYRFNAVLRVGDEMKRQRIELRARGRASAWHPGSRAMLLFHYEEMLAEIKGARKIYRDFGGRRGWREAVKVEHPGLADSIIDKIPSRAYKPSDLAREAAARAMGMPDSEYLNKVLALARKEGAAPPPD